MSGVVGSHELWNSVVGCGSDASVEAQCWRPWLGRTDQGPCPLPFDVDMSNLELPVDTSRRGLLIPCFVQSHDR